MILIISISIFEGVRIRWEDIRFKVAIRIPHPLFGLP